MEFRESEDIRRWSEQIAASPYRSYLYSYPHKTAYRELNPPLPLHELWKRESGESFFLYMHIPFCAARCGFCNLFTLPDRSADAHEQYVAALERQARQWAPMVSHRPFSRFAIGGGTPTLLNERLIERLFDIAEQVMGLDPDRASISVETSPDTVTDARMKLLKERKVDRVSMGIQSFIEAEAAAIYRPQKPGEVMRALEVLKRHDFAVLNLDLIYGLPGQTVESWLYSLDRAMEYEPEEIFIYPLYTRENTILKPEELRRKGQDHRLDMYRAAYERLKEKGYEAFSMRRFAKPDAKSEKNLLPYGCQEEGMVGLGCGARSYTREVHYASRYGVSYKATQSIIADYISASSYDTADYGYVLNLAEQQRRFVIKALLHREGLERRAYEARFASDPFADRPELSRLLADGFAVLEDGTMRLTDEGMAYSDAIGDWLISPEVRERMEEFVCV
ncbi:STM4012 family radical SAM protein [Paenibacillus sp. MZ04-78.2]|uniref:STM4012 family radical SAM protein n=1 Tax=Paenibacillus sp. MZ04-78.2 TaxID=2962034 RepID=UPI0020B80D3E|nr:STM4012 family radical SAM protein [Paenibacillus sp. MZ04-78.2]MCP3772938.1 STM4012 family radical SAM protein [Paenibacillus sp. MZ04-78.2]